MPYHLHLAIAAAGVQQRSGCQRVGLDAQLCHACKLCHRLSRPPLPTQRLDAASGGSQHLCLRLRQRERSAVHCCYFMPHHLRADEHRQWQATAVELIGTPVLAATTLPPAQGPLFAAEAAALLLLWMQVESVWRVTAGKRCGAAGRAPCQADCGCKRFLIRMSYDVCGGCI